MATVRIVDNIFEKDSVRTVEICSGEYGNVMEAASALASEDSYSGQMIECYDPDTDETTWEAADDGENLSISVFANGKEVSSEYVIEESDEILIIVIPAGGRSGWGIIGAVIGVVVGVVASIFTAGIAASSTFTLGAIFTNGIINVTAGQVILGALVGGVVGFALGTSLYDMTHKGSATGNTESLEGRNYPGVRGTKNQSLLGKSYPFVLGRHSVTPPFITSSYTRSDGKYGETQTVAVAFAAGYAPLRLTEFRLGDLILAYNKPTVSNPERPTIMRGRFNRPGTGEQVNPQWRDATRSELDSMLATGTVRRASHTYTYVDYSSSRSGGYGYGYSGGAVTRTASYYVYSSSAGGVRILNSSIYSPGTVQIYAPEYTTDETDSGEILHRWINNDIELEILQQDPDGEADWGTVIPQTIIQDEINATPLYVCDGLLGGVAVEYGVTYKGCYFDNGFRNNTVRFSRAYPMKLELELEAQNGLNVTYQYKNSVIYESIPCWYAIQWRPYNTAARDSNVEVWDAEPEHPWRTFEHINRYTDEDGNTVTPLYPETYTEKLHNADIAAHRGNSYIDTASNGWVGCRLFNLGALVDNVGGTSKDRISMQRFTAVVDLSESRDLGEGEFGGADWLRREILNIGDGGKEEMNSNHSIEVRVVRVSPCYLNQTKGDNDDTSARQYSDIVKWTTLTTFTFDTEKLSKSEGYSLEPQKVTTEEELRKLCIVAIRAKADTGGNIQNQLQKFNFTAESFSPTFTVEDGAVVVRPESIKKRTAYYRPVKWAPENGESEKYDLNDEITREEYEELRQDGWPAVKRKRGNDFTDTMLRAVFAAGPDEQGRILLDRETRDRYIDNNSASSAMLALLGMQNGIDALGYEDLNMESFAEFYEFCRSVCDGSTYPNDETVFNDDLSSVTHFAGEQLNMKFSCNAYVTSAQKVETILQKCLSTGRALLARDEHNRIKVVIDRPNKNPVMLINQQNVISGTNMISYESVPAGLQLNFEDEEDGFAGHSVYAMDIGEDYRNPTKEIETHSIDFVTNRHQLISLGKYVLSTRIMQRETLTRKIGPEGFCAEIGDLVKVSDDTILIGTDLGARVKEVIEDSAYIYGVITDETFIYTGETEDDGAGGKRSVQGAEFMQPTKYKQSRVVSYRFALPGAEVRLPRVVIDGSTYTTGGKITVDGVEYEMTDNRLERRRFDGHLYDFYFLIDGEVYPVEEKAYRQTVGETNVMLFDKPVSKEGYYKEGEDSQLTYYKPETDDIVAFGLVGKTTSLYMVTRIKPDKDYNFDLTLVQYDEAVYMVGERMPSVESNMTIPDRSGDDSFPLSDSMTPAEAQRLVASNVSLITNLVLSGGGEAPDTPLIRTCRAGRDGIALACSPLPAEAKNSVASATWQRAVLAEGESAAAVPEERWTDITTSPSLETTYAFDRETDGWPEREDLAGATRWLFRVRITNAYGLESEWSGATMVNADLYGTWIPLAPEVTVSSSKRVVTLIIGQPASNRTQYSTVRYRIGIRKPGTDEVDAFYRPDLSSDPYIDEGNYRTAVPFDPATLGAYEECSEIFRQSLPLTGQNSVIYKNSLTAETGGSETAIRTWYSGTVIDGDTDGEVTAGDLTIRFAQMEWSGGVGTYRDGETAYKLRSVQESSPAPEDTMYMYRIVPHSVETGADGEPTDTQAVAGANSIQDIVNGAITADKLAPDSVVQEKLAAGAVTAEKIAVRELSAITANMGAITDGALAGNSNNFWALSAGHYNGVYRAAGTFRVGDDENYIEVRAYDAEGLEVTQESQVAASYSLAFRAGTFEVASDIASFENEFAVYSADGRSRLYITSEGLSLQRLESASSRADWENAKEIEVLSRLYADEKGNMILTNSLEGIPFATNLPDDAVVYPMNSEHSGGGDMTSLDGVDTLSLGLSSDGLTTDDAVPLKRGNGLKETECYGAEVEIAANKRNIIVWNKGVWAKLNGEETLVGSTAVMDAWNEGRGTEWGLDEEQAASLDIEAVLEETV